MQIDLGRSATVPVKAAACEQWDSGFQHVQAATLYLIIAWKMLIGACSVCAQQYIETWNHVQSVLCNYWKQTCIYQWWAAEIPRIKLESAGSGCSMTWFTFYHKMYNSYKMK